MISCSSIRSESFGKVLAAFETYHPHDDDCWYLPLIGVDPDHQGEGLGNALMKHATNLLDERGALGYLEASSAANAARVLYSSVSAWSGSSSVVRPPA